MGWVAEVRGPDHFGRNAQRHDVWPARGPMQQTMTYILVSVVRDEVVVGALYLDSDCLIVHAEKFSTLLFGRVTEITFFIKPFGRRDPMPSGILPSVVSDLLRLRFREGPNDADAAGNEEVPGAGVRLSTPRALPRSVTSR